MLSISHKVGGCYGQNDQNHANGRHRPVSRLTPRREQAQACGNWEDQQHDVLYYYSDEFQHLPTAPFPVRGHFHVSKPEEQRKTAQAFAGPVTAFATAMAFSLMTIAVLLGVSAVVVMEKSAFEQARV